MEYQKITDIKRLKFIIKALHDKLPKGAEILDVGCGNGIISRSLGKEGFNVKGVDVSDKAIEKATALNTFPNVRFEVMSAEQLIADGQKYHAVICSEVLEHLNEPSKLLVSLQQLLHDDGILIVTVPNGKGPRETFVTRPMIALQKKQNWVWKAMLKIKSALGYKGTTIQSDAADLTHIQFFTRKSLSKLAGENKFQIQRFGKTNFVEDVFPFSMVTKRVKFLQKADCAFAEILPYNFTGGFLTVWTKSDTKK
ncbi:MAG: hypothetical protein DI535_08720 [Citrobacter freundii]|nr:MAG: hypothetical protein DI535_08720 [Citrobacter freundii]